MNAPCTGVPGARRGRLLVGLVLVFFGLLHAAAALAADGVVWVEAESATDKVQHSNDWYDPVDRQTSLSGNDWWHSFDEPNMDSGYAVIPFNLPESARYTPWLRVDIASTGYRYAIDGEKPQELPLDRWRKEDADNRWEIDHQRRVFDESYAAHDGSNRHRLVWVRLDPRDMKAGRHSLRVEVKPGKDNKGFAAMDCFVLVKEGATFRPRMFYKPGERVRTVAELDEQDAWPAFYETDEFGPSPIDLRHLNEKEAGQHGFIGLSDDGESFVRGDGRPIRFWSGSNYQWRIPFKDKNLTVGPQEKADVAHHARWAAKRGVNMVRFHGHLPPKEASSTRGDVNLTDLHGAWYMVAAFKKEGIYSTISPYWGSHTDNNPNWDLGFDGGSLTGLVFFYEPVQEMYKGWIKRLFTEKNPYTGIPLKDDPALAIIQLQNEDSLLFYTESQIRGKPREVLCRKFAEFLKEKYGSLEEAFTRYRTDYESGWDLRGEDSVEKNTAAMLQMWFHTLDAKNRAGRWADEKTRNRLDDQLEFYTLLMRRFNADMERYLRDELGCKQLINAGNWKSVDPVAADDAERYAYTANEVIARNSYYSAIHAGINTGWQILAQQSYTNWSSLTRPRFWPMNVKQVAGHPFLITESLWVPPNLYASEGPLVVAGQMSLTGVDSFYWFASGTVEWGDVHGKWVYNRPMQMGMFPAAALAFRRGYIAEAEEPVVHEERGLEDIFRQRTPLIGESPTWDPNRDKGDMPVDSSVDTPVDPIAFVAGPVEVEYGGDAANNRVSPRLEELVDTKNKTVTSITGQITTDFQDGLYLVDAPRCQAAAGFLGKRSPVALKDVTIRCKNDYATIMVVPLDGRPLAESRKVLVQVGTVARPKGWIARRRIIETKGTEHDGLQILRLGEEPLMIANAHATVEIANPRLTTAEPLDLNGMPMQRRLSAKRRGGRIAVELPEDALYTVLSAE
jgi:hypothetical protein